jgi:hypothetical protein
MASDVSRDGSAAEARERLEELARIVIDSALDVHKTLGPLGLLITFNVPLLRDGIRRVVLTRRS